MWTEDHFGNNQGPVKNGFAADWTTEFPECDVFGNGRLTRFTDREPCWSGLLYDDRMVEKVISSDSYDDMCQPYEFSDYEADHGNAHMYVNGHMAALSCAPLDPFFWSHHCYVDMLAEMLHSRLPKEKWYYPNSWYVHRQGLI